MRPMRSPKGISDYADLDLEELFEGSMTHPNTYSINFEEIQICDQMNPRELDKEGQKVADALQDNGK